jgi:hypothetical protein
VQVRSVFALKPGRRERKSSQAASKGDRPLLGGRRQVHFVSSKLCIFNKISSRFLLQDKRTQDNIRGSLARLESRASSAAGRPQASNLDPSVP